MKSIYLLWEIPLALCSFVFYKVMKLIIGNLFTVYLAINQDKASQWRILSQEVIDSPLSLPVLMTKGPRWNTHAVIGTLGPFKVENSLNIDLISANNSARSWIVVIYSFPGYQTITSIASNQIESTDPWYSLALPSGKYSLGVRYYNHLDRLDFPAIKVDDQELVAAKNIDSKVNDFYDNLINYKNWFYSSLHYYIFTILKLRNWLPEWFIRREFLPVGAPATYFFYNYLDSNQQLKLDFEFDIINKFDIYFTLYDRSSLPLEWCVIKQPEYLVGDVNSQGFYLLRIRPKPEFANIQSSIKLEEQLIRKTDSLQHWQIKSINQ